MEFLFNPMIGPARQAGTGRAQSTPYKEVTVGPWVFPQAMQAPGPTGHAGRTGQYSLGKPIKGCERIFPALLAEDLKG